MRGFRITSIVVTALVLASSAILFAKGGAGVYCIVDKVVLEPNDKAPERVQIWGAFAVSSSTNNNFGTPAAGYMYIKLPARAKQSNIARKEWADMQAVAGTGQAIGFGVSWSLRNGRVRRVTDKAKSPDEYPGGLNNVDEKKTMSELSVKGSNGSSVITHGGLIHQIREVFDQSRAVALTPGR